MVLSGDLLQSIVIAKVELREHLCFGVCLVDGLLNLWKLLPLGEDILPLLGILNCLLRALYRLCVIAD